jgi:glycogen debranching enzyme
VQRAGAEPIASAPPGSGGPPAQFSVPAAASLQERRPRTLKHGDTFAVFDRNGDVLSGPGIADGVFHRDTRYLSYLYLMVDGQRPLLLSSTVRDDNAAFISDLTNPDVFDSRGKLILEHDLLHLSRSRFLWNGACYERLAVRNFDERPRQVRIDLTFAADFADVFEVRGAHRSQRGTMQAPDVGADYVTLAYCGLDDRRRATTLRFEPAPDRLSSNLATFVFDLDPKRQKTLLLEISCDGAGAGEALHRATFRALREARRALRTSSSRAAAMITSNAIFNETLRRSVSDLYTLITDTPEGPFPYAGIPWFSTVFGRDALITALETLWLDPAISRGVLLHLAANQATTFDPASDAEPGKILHEVRCGEMAELREVPFRRYYGSVDSTPLFVMLAGAYLERTRDVATLRRLWPNIEAALSWLEKYGDRDGDGFVEYARRSNEGLANQGWKDSHDSIFHSDGSLAKGPIALVEVQAYAFGAWRAAAAIARAVGRPERAVAFDERAQTLRTAFDAAFFDPTLNTYVLALDGEKRACRVRASNAGHALLTGLALPERAEAVVNTLTGPASFCGWGVRTVAATEARYNPMSYHNGSVWPHDNALIAAGFTRYGFKREAARIFEGIFAASTYIDLRRLPELFCGFVRRRTRGPTFYPVACMPQAWAAAAPLFMLQSCLGLGFDLNRSHITFEGPVLPDFVGEVTLLNLALDEATVDVALRRSGLQVVVDILDRRGSVRVVTTS